jgi:hypothetical protein
MQVFFYDLTTNKKDRKMKLFRILIALAILVPLMTACNDDDDNPTASSTSDYRPVSAKAYIEEDSSEYIEMLFRYEGEKLTQLVLTGSDPELGEGVDTIFVDVNYNTDGKIESFSATEYGEFYTYEYDRSGMISKVVMYEDERGKLEFTHQGSSLTSVTRYEEDWDTEELYPITDNFTYESGKITEIRSQASQEVMNKYEDYIYDLEKFIFSYSGENLSAAQFYGYNEDSGEIDDLETNLNFAFDAKNRLLTIDDADRDGTSFEFVYNDDYLTTGTMFEDGDKDIEFNYVWEKGESNIFEVANAFTMAEMYQMNFWSDDFNLFFMTMFMFM